MKNNKNYKYRRFFTQLLTVK